MKAVAVTPGQKDSARMIDASEPVPGQDELLVRVLDVGIDGTDIEINEGLYGKAPAGSDYLIVGHEAIGRIERGKGDFKDGDLVVSTVRRPDDCINCRAGESDMCIKGDYTERGIFGAHGYMAEYYAERPEFMVRIPEELRNVAVLLEPLTIGEKAIYQARKIQERMVWEPKVALVFGAGSLGLLNTVLLRNEGLETYVAGLDPEGSLHARIAEAAGAHYVCTKDVPVDGLASFIEKRMGRPDLILEATGVVAVGFNAIDMLNRNGVLCLLGIYNKAREVCIPGGEIGLDMVLGNQLVFGSVNANRRYFEMGVTHLGQIVKKWPGLLDRFFTRRLPLDAYADGLNRMPEDIKVVLKVHGEG